MSEIRNWFYQNKTTLNSYLSLVAIVLVLTLIAYGPANTFYSRFLAGFSPYVVFPVVFVIGFVCLIVLKARGWFSIVSDSTSKRVWPVYASAAILPFVSVAIDLWVHFPKDMNQWFPGSLAFYPSIAFLVEVVFHVFPTTVLYLFLEKIFPKSRENIKLWFGLLLVACIEPSYQAISMIGSSRYPSIIPLVVFLNLLIFNTAQLLAFKRNGFLVMYTMRIVFYLIWHVVWGQIRLYVIFE